MHPFPASMMMQGLSGGSAILKPQDVHATTLYTGTGSAKTITTGLDMAGQGGRLWVKIRDSGGTSHGVIDTVRGASKVLIPDQTIAQFTAADAVTAFTSTEFILGKDTSAGNINPSGASLVAWSDLQAPKYLQIRTFTHTSGTADTFDMAVLGVVGEVTVKRTDAASNWIVWHRSLSSGNLLVLNLTNAQSASTYISISGTTVTIDANIPSGTYYLEAWAHDPDTTNGIIQCGIFTGGDTVTLGWQPQFVMFKSINAAENWQIRDAARGQGLALFPNLSNAEVSAGGIGMTSTGLSTPGLSAGTQYIYLAIRAAY